MAYEAAEALMDDDVTSGDAVKFGEIINILKNLECFASTVEEVDLFNNLQNILITNADEDFTAVRRRDARAPGARPALPNFSQKRLRDCPTHGAFVSQPSR